MGSSASVSRTTASKLSSIVRLTFSHPASPKVPRHAASALLTSGVEVVVMLAHVGEDAPRIGLGEVHSDPGRGHAERIGQRGEPISRRDEHELGAGLASEAAGGRLADPTRGLVTLTLTRPPSELEDDLAGRAAGIEQP